MFMAGFISQFSFEKSRYEGLCGVKGNVYVFNTFPCCLAFLNLYEL